MDKRLSNKVIVISGGTSGVGKAAAIAFVNEGAKVIVGGRKKENSPKEALFVKTDLNKIKDCKNLFDTAVNKYGRIDGFFDYAGVTSISSLDTCDEKTFDEIMDVNFKSAFFCCQEAINIMKKNNGGSIILTGSAHAWGGQIDRAAYACSKGALLTLSDHIAKNYAKDNIRCNYFTLGWTATEGELALRKEQKITEKELKKQASKIIPMGRMLENGDYLEMLIYLMSDLSKMMTGSILRITGGEYI